MRLNNRNTSPDILYTFGLTLRALNGGAIWRFGGAIWRFGGAIPLMIARFGCLMAQQGIAPPKQGNLWEHPL